MSYSRVFLGLGSNVERVTHLSTALEMLAEHLTGIRCSPIFESDSVGCAGPSFFNLVVAAETNLPLKDLVTWLKDIEQIHGRRSSVRPELVTLDIDILTYGELVGEFEGVKLPRDEILQRSYVLLPLALLAPKSLHPEAGVSFAELWRRACVGPRLRHVREWRLEDRGWEVSPRGRLSGVASSRSRMRHFEMQNQELVASSVP